MTNAVPDLKLLEGRYAVGEALASGGMGTVYYGHMIGPVGISRRVAIKRLHPHLAGDERVVAGLVDEARLASRVHHPNVVPVLDVVLEGDELSLVMDYVEGVTLACALARARQAGPAGVPEGVAAAVITGVLHGLHAAHEATDEAGRPLGVVHRDVTPQNVLLGADGLARLTDFGVATALGRLQTTQGGELKGKVAYMAPEQIDGRAVDRRADLYAVAVVLWEVLTGRRLFEGDSHAAVAAKVLLRPPRRPGEFATVTASLEALVMRGLAREPAERFPDARAMALALEAIVAPASPAAVSEWLGAVAGAALAERREQASRFARSLEAQLAGRTVELPPLIARRAGAARGAEPVGRLGGAEPAELTLGPSTQAALRTATGRSRAGAYVGTALAVATLGASAFVLGRRSASGDLGASGGLVPAASSGPEGAMAPGAEAAAAQGGPRAGAAMTPGAAPSGAVGAAAGAATPSARAGDGGARAAGAGEARSSGADARPRGTAPAGALRAPRPRATADAACRDPYYFDAEGIRHVKRECL